MTLQFEEELRPDFVKLDQLVREMLGEERYQQILNTASLNDGNLDELNDYLSSGQILQSPSSRKGQKNPLNMENPFAQSDLMKKRMKKKSSSIDN